MEACCCQAFEKVYSLLDGVDKHLAERKEKESLTDDIVARMRFEACKVYFDWAAFCARRSTQHFLPTVEKKGGTNVTMPDLTQDNSPTLLLGEKARKMMEALLQEMSKSPLSKTGKTATAFNRCSAVCTREALWFDAVYSIIHTGNVSYDVPARVAVLANVRCLPPSEIKYTCDC